MLFALITGLYFFGAAMFSGDYYDSRFMWFFLAMAGIGAIRNRAQHNTATVKKKVQATP